MSPFFYETVDSEKVRTSLMVSTTKVLVSRRSRSMFRSSRLESGPRKDGFGHNRSKLAWPVSRTDHSPSWTLA